MYRLYSHILKNGTGIAGLISDKILTELSDITISVNHLTTYIPIPSTDISKFLFELTNKLKEEFENSNILELPKLEYELIFSLTEEIKDFFQENLC